MQQNFPIKTGETAFLFLQHFIKYLKAGGRAGVVIKNTFLSNYDNDLAEFVELQASFTDSDQSWTVDVSDIDTDTWDLSAKNPNRDDEVELRDPVEIIEEMVALDSESAMVLPGCNWIVVSARPLPGAFSSARQKIRWNGTTYCLLNRNIRSSPRYRCLMN